jgi:hypothetical protein
MESREERLARLRKASEASAQAADAQLADELEVLRQLTAARLASLRPKVQDQQAFDQLVAAVEASTRSNETKAQFRQRLSALGHAVMDTARELAGLVT